VRNRAIHFDPLTDTNDRALALEALAVLGDVIRYQLSLGRQPWYLSGVPGEVYLKKESEVSPFIRRAVPHRRGRHGGREDDGDTRNQSS
jgi:hypothetical protein